MSRLRVAILGSTGSIGRQALDVAARFPERIEIVALTAHSSVTALLEAARRFGVTRLALGDVDTAEAASRETGMRIDGGPAAIEAIAGEGGADRAGHSRHPAAAIAARTARPASATSAGCRRAERGGCDGTMWRPFYRTASVYSIATNLILRRQFHALLEVGPRFRVATG